VIYKGTLAEAGADFTQNANHVIDAGARFPACGTAIPRACGAANPDTTPQGASCC